ncbi:hypothetical protein N7505_011312 [Penicillium chrysogenum]|uniref:Uncharacterized protein n=1 Tax=Penicillium chrysogenum TaxID=5076 RepID=A0ABQ8W6D0_PENCH|nr:hypothetical protein N7505_011312 [Penicillium chrysogenum]KAJ5277185.1 hypothetical protein N7524_003338 [Penicillium chrysogenum]
MYVPALSVAFFDCPVSLGDVGIIAAITRTKSRSSFGRRAVILGEADGIPQVLSICGSLEASRGGGWAVTSSRLGASGTQVQEVSWEGLKSNWACTIPV